MNIVECEKGATALAALGDQLTSLLTTLKKETAATDAVWVGPDAERFRSAEWSDIEAAFKSTLAIVRELSDDLRRNITQQKATSA